MQRFKSVETAAVESNWDLAKHYELIPTTHISVVCESERTVAASLKLREAKLQRAADEKPSRKGGGQGSWDRGRGGGKSDPKPPRLSEDEEKIDGEKKYEKKEKGKGRGKDKGKEKGKFKGKKDKEQETSNEANGRRKRGGKKRSKASASPADGPRRRERGYSPGPEREGARQDRSSPHRGDGSGTDASLASGAPGPDRRVGWAQPPASRSPSPRKEGRSPGREGPAVVLTAAKNAGKDNGKRGGGR